MNMSQRVDDLIFVSEHLIALLHKENAALARQDDDTVDLLIEEKDALCRAYEQRAMVLTKFSDELADEDIEQQRVEMVHEMGKQIHELIEENATLLRAAIEANSLVMSLVAEAVRQVQSSDGTYGAKGSIARKVTKSPADTPIAFDQSL